VTSLFLCVCVFVSLVAYFHYTTPNIGVLYIYNMLLDLQDLCKDSWVVAKGVKAAGQQNAGLDQH